jgi:hypothetical protein
MSNRPAIRLLDRHDSAAPVLEATNGEGTHAGDYKDG